MKGFLLSLRSEFFKSRKTLGFWAAIILPIVISTLVFIIFYTNAAENQALPGIGIWLKFSGIIMGFMGILLPFFIIFAAYSINSVEHKADTWKTLFSLPISKWSVYTAKYLYSVLMILICVTLFLLFTIGSGNLLGVLKPELRFADFHMEGAIAMVFLKLFLTSLGILSIQFLLSLIWSDFLKPMGLGFVFVISGIIMAGPLNWKYAYLFPYTHPMMALRSLSPHVKGKGKNLQTEYVVDLFTKDLYVGLIVAVVVFVSGYYIVQRKSVK